MSAIDDILASMRGHAKAPAAAAAQAHRSPSPAEDEEPNSSGEVPKLDGSRRVAGADALDYRFRSGLLQLSEEDAVALRADCSMAFALNSSNWLPAAAKPRCSLERLARTIFERHTAGVAFDAASSGAEWWAQVRGGGERHEGIEFHWDVDEHLCDLPGGGGVHVHPHLSTVTYLTNSGSPTLVLDAGAAQSSSRGAISALYGQVPSGALSYPRLGKTIVFDGAKLHGAVPPRGLCGTPGSTRVTFLVNIWLNHRPHAVEPLPASLAASMCQQWRPPTATPLGAFAVDLDPPQVTRVEPLAGAAGGGGGGGGGATATATTNTNAAGGDRLQVLEVSFGRNDKVHALKVQLPVPREGGGSYRLAFGEGAAEIGPNKGGLRCDRDRGAGGVTGAHKRAAGQAARGAGTSGLEHASGADGGAAAPRKKKKKKKKDMAGHEP
jgi:hypothetical protein